MAKKSPISTKLSTLTSMSFRNDLPSFFGEIRMSFAKYYINFCHFIYFFVLFLSTGVVY